VKNEHLLKNQIQKNDHLYTMSGFNYYFNIEPV